MNTQNVEVDKKIKKLQIFSCLNQLPLSTLTCLLKTNSADHYIT